MAVTAGPTGLDVPTEERASRDSVPKDVASQDVASQDFGSQDLGSLNLADPAFRADPYPTYARLRREAPLVRNDGMGYWLLSRYRDVAAALRDTATFSSASFHDRPVSSHDPANTAHAELLTSFGSTMIFQDPPVHTRLRKLVNRPFTAAQINRRRDPLTDLCRALLQVGQESGRFDFVRDYAAPFPILVIAELLGVPVSDRGLIKDLSYQFGILFEPMLPLPDRTNALNHSVELAHYLDTTIEDRRRAARDDIVSVLVSAQEDNDTLSADELRGTLLHLLVAGNETSTSLLTHTALVFQSSPHIRAALARNPERAAACVDEVLRYDPPLQMLSRQVTRDVSINGVTMRRGDLVALVLAAANRDEEQFDDPEHFDLERRNSSHYVSFGLGPHFCIGAPLAKLEGEISAQLLATEFSDINVTPELGVRRPDQLIRGYLSLPAHTATSTPR